MRLNFFVGSIDYGQLLCKNDAEEAANHAVSCTERDAESCTEDDTVSCGKLARESLVIIELDNIFSHSLHHLVP